MDDPFRDERNTGASRAELSEPRSRKRGRSSDVRCVSLYPGAVNAGLGRGLVASYWWMKTPLDLLAKVLMVTLAEGALNQLWAATSADAKSGKYYIPVAKENAGSAFTQDKELGDQAVGLDGKGAGDFRRQEE